jgi:hypothetical protein
MLAANQNYERSEWLAKVGVPTGNRRFAQRCRFAGKCGWQDSQGAMPNLALASTMRF